MNLWFLPNIIIFIHFYMCLLTATKELCSKDYILYNIFYERLTKRMMQQSKVTGHGILETISRGEMLRQADVRQTHRAVLVNK